MCYIELVLFEYPVDNIALILDEDGFTGTRDSYYIMQCAMEVEVLEGSTHQALRHSWTMITDSVAAAMGELW